MAQIAPPPTYADPVIVDETTKKGQFNPIWLQWFIVLAQYINQAGGSDTTNQHNQLQGLQGGDATLSQYFHLTNQQLSDIVSGIGQIGNLETTTAANATAIANLTPRVVPTGTLIIFAVGSPTGYLACNGQLVSRTTYSALFGVIGTTFGTGDGSTTFQLPNITSPAANLAYWIKT